MGMPTDYEPADLSDFKEPGAGLCEVGECENRASYCFMKEFMFICEDCFLKHVVSQVPDECCEKCKFFFKEHQCHRFPPVNLEWPVVSNYDYCGEYEEKLTQKPS